MKKDWFLNLAMGVLVVCALLVTGLVVRREFFPEAEASPTIPQPRVVSEWRKFGKYGHRMGPADAAVTIVEFSDFQCPFCGVLAERLHALQEKYPDEVAVVYRHFPLATHSHAVAAVRASECAAAQGRFAAFHDALFAARDSIGAIPWSRFATTAGVADTASFRRCADGSGPLRALARDTLAGRRLEVSATPTLLINELRFQGALPMDTLEVYVERALRARRAKRL